MTPLVLCTFTIIVTLAVSGYAKVADPTSTVTAIVNLKLDRLLPLKPTAAVLPWVELALAAALLLAPGLLQILAAVAAAVLFTCYWGVIARAVVRGNTASCNCFGSASHAPVSIFTLIRNTALLLSAFGALIAAFQTRSSALVMLLELNADGWLWVIGAALASLALWAVYRSELVPAPASEEPAGALDRGLPAPADGDIDELEDYLPTPIPYASLHRFNRDSPLELGEEVTLRDLVMVKARVLIWVSPGCGHCHEVISHLEAWQEALPMLGIHPVISSTQAAQSFAFTRNIEFFIDPDYRAEHLFGNGTPGAVALGTDMMLAGGPVFGGNRVIGFMEDIIAELT